MKKFLSSSVHLQQIAASLIAVPVKREMSLDRLSGNVCVSVFKSNKLFYKTHAIILPVDITLVTTFAHHTSAYESFKPMQYWAPSPLTGVHATGRAHPNTLVR